MDRFANRVTVVAFIIVLLPLTACQGVFEFSVESEPQSTPTTLADAPLQPTAPAAGVTSTVEEPTPYTPTVSPITPTAPGDNNTETPASPIPPLTPPSPTGTPEPSPTPAPLRPVVASFAVTPVEAAPGDTVILSWQARGDRATICPSARFVLFTEADCWQVPLSGTSTFTIPSAASEFQSIDFTLTAESTGPRASVATQVSVALKCSGTWFYTNEPQSGICPLEALYTYAAAQRFERGLMVWLERPGRYYIVVDEQVVAGEQRKRLDIISDPLTITGDTSQGIEAPSGLYAPVSGFGLVWRGDIEQSTGYRQVLGWALEPEFGYEAVLQCDNALPSGGRSWQTCYLKGPGAEVLVLHPLDGWYVLSE